MPTFHLLGPFEVRAPAGTPVPVPRPKQRELLALLLLRAGSVVGVEPHGCPTLHAALQAGRPVDVEVGGIAADSLGARRIGEVCWAVAGETGLRSVLVPDEAIARARGRLWGELRVLAEYGGAAALAALVTGAYLPEPGERVAAVVCGGNTDPAAVLADPD